MAIDPTLTPVLPPGLVLGVGGQHQQRTWGVVECLGDREGVDAENRAATASPSTAKLRPFETTKLVPGP